MQTPQAPALNPALLPPGTLVGSWLVVAWAGRGVHGAVYQVVPVDKPEARPKALKLALLPRDPRFVREAELLSLVRHPSVPRLWDSGDWQHPSGALHPFVVMDWVDGAPLYDWARQHSPSSQQVLQLLAQLARVLQTLHSQGCLHRDVKGDNVLVRHSDSRALLTDFGSGRYPHASSLTPDILPPGTPAYRSPEAWLFELQFFNDPKARYSAQPTDDLYSLGVTAYRLVTGTYPELGEPSKDEAGLWHLERLASAPPLFLNPRVDTHLNALILRMLSVRPEHRGTAQELAEALEQAALLTLPESTRSLFSQELSPSVDSGGQAPAASRLAPLPPAHDMAEAQAQAPKVPLLTPSSAERVSLLVHMQPWQLRLATAAALLALGAWVGWLTPRMFPELPSLVRHEVGGALLQEGGEAGLGDDSTRASVAASPSPSEPGVHGQDTLPEPSPGQARPDAKGRCPHPRQIPLNGGCWVKLQREECEAIKGTLLHGTCYVPGALHERQPTSHPVREQ
ncbi:serine/threonine protein kinase [Hyalangium sp.]|uniref:serine/threonine protein kinase n=1 Tax=Hyalangium sp. TaxID=2028555 RepID=UPI002D267656|nr:protein kinase [Hyalangium sp.]HYH99992.1 protein kinase [Hyalangium sp.]